MNTPTIPRRRSIRLQDYDYSRAGAYFLTICTHGKKCLFGKIVDGEMRLNEAGQMVRIAWQGLSLRFPGIELDEFTVMPNHIHGLLVLQTSDDAGTGIRANTRFAPTQSDSIIQPKGTLPDSVGRIVQTFKSMTTHEYIQTNARRWELDKLFLPY